MADGDQHVLVVDDEAQIRQFVRAGMELGGYRVTEATNGSDALREITLHPIDLVILDLALPDIDGSELLERIRTLLVRKRGPKRATAARAHTSAA